MSVDHIGTCAAKAKWWCFCQQLYVMIILKFDFSQEHNDYLGWLAFQRLLKWFWYLIQIPLFIFGLRGDFFTLNISSNIIYGWVALASSHAFPCKRVSVKGCHSARNWGKLSRITSYHDFFAFLSFPCQFEKWPEKAREQIGCNMSMLKIAVWLYRSAVSDNQRFS